MTSPSGSQSVVFPYSNTNNLPIAHEANVAALLVPDFAPFTDQAIYAAVTDEANQNLTCAQKELLLWHWRLGHAGFDWIKQLFSPLPNGRGTILTSAKGDVTRCQNPLCAACLFARQTRRGAGVQVHRNRPKHELMLRANHLEPGDCVSMDQYQSKEMRGRLSKTYGKESEDKKFSGGTIFVDHASAKVFVRHQVSLHAG
jgi:hypothetical protein